VQKLSVAGGEPSMMTEFYDFLEKCISVGRTDFEISITTNANKFNAKFKRLLQHFSNVNFGVSLDGFQDLNYYIRYPGEWNNVVNTMRYLQEQNRLFSTHTTISIYNVDSLHLIFEFMDQEFPGVITDWDFVENPSFMSPFLFPDSQAAIKSLTAVTQTNCYKNAGKIFQERIDFCLEYFKRNPVLQNHQLKEFFLHNDKLDQSRSVCLIDYVPVLDKYRDIVV
jgi:sulfatase maturation enzyme AslB (radical SAM superfamily)